jgi:spore coat protein H
MRETSTGNTNISLGLIVAAVLCFNGVPGMAADKQGRRVRNDEGVFDPAPVHCYRIEISEDGLAILRKDSRQDENQRVYVKATLREGNDVYPDVGIHLKGGAGSFRQLGEKPAFTIKFDQFVPRQRYHGLQKISLNNAVQDPTYLSDLIGNELFRTAGVPAPRIGHARLELNGKDQGFYVVLEAITRDFLRRAFVDSSGNLYKGPGDVDGDIFVDSKSPSKERLDLKALAAAAAEPDRNERQAKMGAILDLDRFASFLAMETINWHWDGYSMAQNNYDIYHDPVSNRLVFFPHDQDQLFGEPGGSIYPHLNGLVARAFRNTSWGGEAYRTRLTALREKVFDPDRLAKRISSLAAKLQPLISETDPEQGKAHREAVEAWVQRIRERAKSIQEQLHEPEPCPPTRLVFEGPKSRPSGWESQTALGQPRFGISDRGGHEQGRALRISAPEKDAWCGSFRTEVILPPGRYYFAGLLKTKGVKPLGAEDDKTDSPSGACLRISGQQPLQKLLGDCDWTWMRFNFTVEQTEGEGELAIGRAELICELRASQGTAWFDEESLEVVQLDGRKD